MMNHKFYKKSVIKFALGENRIDSKFKKVLITKKNSVEMKHPFKETLKTNKKIITLKF